MHRMNQRKFDKFLKSIGCSIGQKNNEKVIKFRKLK